MKKIAMFTWYEGNYGTCLQAYALFKFLELNGYDVYMIGHVNKKTYLPLYKAYNPVYIFKRLYSIAFEKINLAKKLKKNSRYYSLIVKKRQKDKKFINHYLKIANISNKKEYKRFFNRFSCLVSGSDQILNPYYLERKALFDFAKDKCINRISYASSIGVDSIPKKFLPIYKMYLQLFDSLSARENTSAILLHNITKKSVDVVLDPTFLLPKEEYQKIESNSSYLLDYNYILCYFVGNNKDYINFSLEIGRKYNIKVVILPQNDCDYDERLTVAADASIPDFLYLINHCCFAITDSFHATVFSIIFEKEFFVLPRFKDNDEKSQNSRLYDFLDKLMIRNRVINCVDDIGRLNKLDYHKINSIIKREKEKSKDYLLNAISKV